MQQSERSYYAVFSHKDDNGNYDYLYIAESVCWVLEINNVDAYVLKPRTQYELLELINSLNPPESNPLEGNVSLAIGLALTGTSASDCAGITAPYVLLNQLFYFTFSGLISELAKQGSGIEEESIKGLLEQLMSKPNDGTSDEARALNYVAFRFPEIYQKASEMTQANQGYFLESIRAMPSDSSGNRRIIDVVFRYQKFDTGEQQSWYCGVDVTELYPFLNTPLRSFVPSS